MAVSSDDRDRLDRELDAVLSTLAGGDGPADMRARVLGRLARPAPAALWPAWAAAAALIVVAAAGWWAWRGRPLPSQLVRHPTPAPASASPSAGGPAEPYRPTAALADGTKAAHGPRPAAPVRSADEPPLLPPLPVPEPIAVAALEPSRVELEPIDVKPLVLPDLAVTPLEDSGEPAHERKD